MYRSIKRKSFFDNIIIVSYTFICILYVNVCMPACVVAAAKLSTQALVLCWRVALIYSPSPNFQLSALWERSFICKSHFAITSRVLLYRTNFHTDRPLTTIQSHLFSQTSSPLLYPEGPNSNLHLELCTVRRRLNQRIYDDILLYCVF